MISGNLRLSPHRFNIHDIGMLARFKYYHLIITFLLITSLLFLIQPLFESVQFVERNHNEGWNAGHAVRAMNGLNIYDNSELYVTLNYPPLSYYVVGAIGEVIGDVLYAGRIVSFLSFLTIALNVFVIGWKISGSRTTGVLSSLFFISLMGAYYHFYIAMNDPQMLGNALMVTGLMIFVTKPRTAMHLSLVAGLVCAGGFVKQNLVAVPLTITAFLLLFDRKAFVLWLAASLGFLTVAFAVTLGVFGFDFVRSLNNPHWYPFSLLRLGERSEAVLYRLQMPVALWAAQSVLFRRFEDTWLIGIYVVIAMLTGIGFSGGNGVNVNVFFDLVIGLSIAAGVGVHRISELLLEKNFQQGHTTAAMTLLSLALCSGLMIAVPIKVYTFVVKDLKFPEIATETVEDIVYLKARPGAVLCVKQSLCYWAGKGFEFDAINSWDVILAGDKDLKPLLRKIQASKFDVIQLPKKPFAKYHEHPMLQAFLETVNSHYKMDRISVNGIFYTPSAAP